MCLRVRLIVLEHGDYLIVGFSTINHAVVADGAGTKDTVAVTERWGFLGRLTVTQITNVKQLPDLALPLYTALAFVRSECSHRSTKFIKRKRGRGIEWPFVEPEYA